MKDKIDEGLKKIKKLKEDLDISDWFGLMLITVVLPWGIYFIVNK